VHAAEAVSAPLSISSLGDVGGDGGATDEEKRKCELRDLITPRYFVILSAAISVVLQLLATTAAAGFARGTRQ